MKLLTKTWLDKTGFCISAFCMVHCVGIPALLSVTSFTSLSFLKNPSIEYVIIVLSATLGISSFLPAYLKHHNSPKALLYSLTGFTLIGIGQFIDLFTYEPILTSTGAGTIAYAHYLNMRLIKKKCKNCGMRENLQFLFR